MRWLWGRIRFFLFYPKPNLSSFASTYDMLLLMICFYLWYASINDMLLLMINIRL